MISFEEAIDLIRSAANPLGVEKVKLEQAFGRVLAAPVVAQIDSPRTDVSAMDGYAVREGDMENLPARLQIVGKSFAGAGWNSPLVRGTCARIFTGAPVPAGADRVVIQENVRCDGDVAIIDQAPGGARHIRKRGSDFGKGDVLLERGRLIDPRAIVAAAGADVEELELCRRPRLLILSTGDELAEPGTARDRPDAVPESLSLGIAALAEQWGAACVGRKRLRDDLDSMREAAARAVQDADIVVVTGGASVGERDLAKAMFEPFGLELIFSKVAIKPGKPVWFGHLGTCLTIGLPGNPTSALVTARLLLVPLLALVQGRRLESALEWKMGRLGSALMGCADRETFHRAVMRNGTVKVLPFEDSSAQKTLADADVLVRQPANSPGLDAGEMVPVLDF